MRLRRAEVPQTLELQAKRFNYVSTAAQAIHEAHKARIERQTNRHDITSHKPIDTIKEGKHHD